MPGLRKPSWWAVLLTIAGVLLFVRLGIWQLDRAQQKDRLLDRFSHAVAQPARPFAEVAGVDAEQLTGYPHVMVRGRLEGDRRYILDNRDNHGRPGVNVYVPMHVCIQPQPCKAWHTRTLLVGLGFLPRENGWRELPKLPPLETGLVSLAGLYAPPPGKGLELGGNALERQSEWPKLTTYLDMAQVSHDLNEPLYPRILLLDADPASAYVRSWTPATMPPARHRAYAFQWFSLALAAVVIFLVMHRRRTRNEPDHGPD